MKVDTQTKQNVEKKENIIQMQPEDVEILSSSNVPFSDILMQKLNSAEDSSELNSDLCSLGIDYDYNSLSINLEDALFFVNLAQEGQFSVESTKTGDFKSIVKLDVSQNVVSTKTIEVTNQLTSLIEKAQKTQKPVRISFDNDVSVILKIDKHGRVTAEFIPGSIEVENYLRNNIVALRQKFDEQNLPYNDLYYRQNNSKQNRNKNDKEKGEQ